MQSGILICLSLPWVTLTAGSFVTRHAVQLGRTTLNFFLSSLKLSSSASSSFRLSSVVQFDIILSSDYSLIILPRSFPFRLRLRENQALTPRSIFQTRGFGENNWRNRSSASHCTTVDGTCAWSQQLIELWLISTKYFSTVLVVYELCIMRNYKTGNFSTDEIF